MGRAFTARAVINGQDSGVDIFWDFQDGGQHQIRNIHYDIPAGITVTAVVRDSGAIIAEQTLTGPASGSVNVQGTYRMVEEEPGVFALPSEISYKIEVTN